MLAQYVFRLGEYILEKCPWYHAQGDLTINASERQIVNLVAEGRNIRPLARIHIHGQNIFAVNIKMRSEIETERRVSAPVFSDPRAVDPHGGCRHHAFEVDKYVPSARFRRELEMTPITGNELIGLLVKTVPGHTNIGVGNNHPFIGEIVEALKVRPFYHLAAVKPAAIHGENQTAFGGALSALFPRQRGGNERRSRDQSTCCFEKVAAIHKFFRLSGQAMPGNYLRSSYVCKRLRAELVRLAWMRPPASQRLTCRRLQLMVLLRRSCFNPVLHS